MSEPKPGTTMGRIADLERQVRELRALLDDALDRIGDLENSTPEARQAQYEADWRWLTWRSWVMASPRTTSGSSHEDPPARRRG